MTLPSDHRAAALPAQTARLAGDNRYATAVEISKAAFPTGAPIVYLARADTYPDGLAAGALTDGPILLVPSSAGLPAVVTGELARLDPTRVVALGGTGAVSDAVLNAAANAAGAVAERLAGANRYATAVQISKAGFPAGAEVVYLARADDFPDALAAGALTGGPILLVPSTGALPSVVTGELGRLDPTRVVALGGTGAVSDAVLNAAANAAGAVAQRLAGGNRYTTAVEISKAGFPTGAPVVYLARADLFPDALAAGSLNDGPILLVPPCAGLPSAVASEIARLGPGRVVALGGDSAICAATLTAAAALGSLPVELVLANAWVPPLCGHEAGYVENGELPVLIPPNGPDPGYLRINLDMTVSGQFDADDADEYATTVTCAGGDPLPHDYLLVYDDDLSVTAVLLPNRVWKDVIIWFAEIPTLTWEESVSGTVTIVQSFILPLLNAGFSIDENYPCITIGDPVTGTPSQVDARTGGACGPEPACISGAEALALATSAGNAVDLVEAVWCDGVFAEASVVMGGDPYRAAFMYLDGGWTLLGLGSAEFACGVLRSYDPLWAC